MPTRITKVLKEPLHTLEVDEPRALAQLEKDFQNQDRADSQFQQFVKLPFRDRTHNEVDRYL